MDVGAGNGILSFFAAQAGAKKVYAIEASNMVECLQKVVDASKPTREAEVTKAEKEALELMGAGDAGLAGWFRHDDPAETRNGWLQGKLVPVHSKVEDVTAKQLEGHTQVDTIVSECLGVLLVHERMCESFSRRKRSIPSSGRVGLPFGGTICLARSRTSSCGTIPPTKRNGGSNNRTFTASTSHPSPPSLSRRTFPARRRRFPGQCLLSVSSDT